MTTDTILGIDPGTRFVGIAVMRDGALLHYKIRAFQGPWSSRKLNSILLYLESTIARYGIKKIATKIPDVFPLSPGYNQLIGSFNVLCSGKGIKPAYYTLNEIKIAYGKEKIETTDELMQILVLKYPELWVEYKKEQKNENPHYHKLFAAVAVADLQ